MVSDFIFSYLICIAEFFGYCARVGRELLSSCLYSFGDGSAFRGFGSGKSFGSNVTIVEHWRSVATLRGHAGGRLTLSLCQLW